MDMIKAQLKFGLTKRQKFCVVCIILIIAGIFGINYFLKKNETFYEDSYHVKFTTKSVDIFIPKYSYFEGIGGIITAEFKNPRSYKKLKKEVSEYLGTLEEVSCNGNTYYYDKNQNFLIYLYKVSNGFPFRKIEISYTYGNPCQFD